MGQFLKPILWFENVAFGDNTEFKITTKVPIDVNDPTFKLDSVYWNFDDGIYSSGPADSYNTVYHQFGAAQDYLVNLEVKTDLGCFADTTIKIPILQTIKTYPYFADFESSSGTNNIGVVGGQNSSWQIGTPNGYFIKGAYSGVNSWITSLNSTYNSNEISYINLPSFDLTSLLKPMISLAIWSNAESQRDGAALQYSTDGGQMWYTLNDLNEKLGINIYPASNDSTVNHWYDDKGLISNPGVENPATDFNEGAYGWTGRDDNWRLVRFPLDQLKGQSAVRFRVAFSSDANNAQDDLDGFAFDDLWVGERKRTVLAEHFTSINLNGSDIITINNLADASKLDLLTLQYHTSYSPDDIYNDNPAVPNTRSSVYNLTQVPKTFLNGYLSFDNKKPLQSSEVVNQAMRDNEFSIRLEIDPTQQSNTVRVNVFVKANKVVDHDIIVHMAMTEDSIKLGSGPLLRNIVKDMLPSPGGTVIRRTWNIGDEESFTELWNLNGLNIYDGKKLGVVVFVQNPKDLVPGNAPNNTLNNRIFQAAYAKLPEKNPAPITGLDDELISISGKNISLYPNPTKKYFTVSFGDKLNSDYKWKIVDQRGVQLMHGQFDKGDDKFELNISDLIDGVYMFMITDEKKVYVTRKLMILK